MDANTSVGSNMAHLLRMTTATSRGEMCAEKWSVSSDARRNQFSACRTRLALRRSLALGLPWGPPPELGGRIHGLILFESDGQMIDQRPDRRHESALGGKHDVHKPRLLVPLR